MIIKHANIIYMPHISQLGGIETYVYELVKKYNKLDIAVVTKQIELNQRKRLEQYCNVYIHTNERIECKVAIINYDQTIINYINEEAKIYQTIHADYTNPIYIEKPKPNPRVYKFIAITNYLKDKMKDMLYPNDVMLSYNPLTIDDDKPIILVSATRLHKFKGKDRMQLLANELDKQNVNYLWFIISNDRNVITGKNIIFIQSRDDIPKWLSFASYVVLLSDSEACSYTINEALYRNIPVIVTPLPYLEEIGVKDNENAYIVKFDCSNIKDVVSKIKNVPKFNFARQSDKYNTIFAKDKSKFIPDNKIFDYVRVKEKVGHYYDTKLCRDVYYEEGKYQVTRERRKELCGANVCDWIEE